MSGSESLHCLIIDDHPVVRQGIRALLEREIDSVVVTDAATPAAAFSARAAESGSEAPHVVIVDPRGDGAEVG
jgi:DNA-binding NarL/FixJ family response regulator